VGAHPEGGPLAVENHNIIGEGGAGFKVAGLRVVGCFEKELHSVGPARNSPLPGFVMFEYLVL